MLQRLRKCFGNENNNELYNEVEADENYVGVKNKNRHSNKKKLYHKEEVPKTKLQLLEKLSITVN